MAYYELYADRDSSSYGIRKGSKIEVVTKGNLAPTTKDIQEAIKEKYGENAVQAWGFFKLPQK